MPIILKDYTWSQTDEHIRVRVPLRSATRKSLDIIVQPTFIKISAPPYLFEVYLAHAIVGVEQPADSPETTRIYENEIRLRLRKAAPRLAEWSQLERTVAHAETVTAKQEIIRGAHQLAAEADKERAQRKHDIKQAEIQKEIARESAIRAEVDRIQRSACGVEMTAVECLKAAPAKKASTKPSSSAIAKHCAAEPPSRPIPAVPSIRSAATIGVQFSERRFPTPMRESQAPVEQEWLLKQNEARRAVGFVEEDLRPEERNVDWLKAKGCEFFAKANYLGAVSAFSTGIRLNPKCYDLYVNRASCQFVLKNYNRCVSGGSVEDIFLASRTITSRIPTCCPFFRPDNRCIGRSRVARASLSV